MRSNLRIALSFLILLPLAGVCIYFTGRANIHAPIKLHAAFGSTPAQCQAAYGPANVVLTNPVLVSPKTLGYTRGGFSIMVSFDEANHAEQFVFSKANLIKKEPLDKEEQKALLAAFSDGSKWAFEADNGNGPIWKRADGAYASYIKDHAWLVLMNAQGMNRRIHALKPR